MTIARPEKPPASLGMKLNDEGSALVPDTRALTVSHQLKRGTTHSLDEERKESSADRREIGMSPTVDCRRELGRNARKCPLSR